MGDLSGRMRIELPSGRFDDKARVHGHTSSLKGQAYLIGDDSDLRRHQPRDREGIYPAHPAIRNRLSCTTCMPGTPADGSVEAASTLS